MNNQPPEHRFGLHWYVVHTRPRNEEQVAQALSERLGIRVYLPHVRQRKHGKVQASPYFQCYLFIRTDFRRTAMSAINTTPGVVKLLSCGADPIRLGDEIFQELQRHVDELNQRGGTADPRLYPGVAVRLRSGPLRGLEGAFVGPTSPSARVRVLLDFLGSLREAEVDAGAIELIASTPPPPPRERRTRGGGRRIA